MTKFIDYNSNLLKIIVIIYSAIGIYFMFDFKSNLFISTIICLFALSVLLYIGYRMEQS